MTTWDDLTTAITKLTPGTTITINPVTTDSPWMQALVPDDTTDTRLVLNRNPGDNLEDWTTTGWTDTDPHTWETTLPWPTPTTVVTTLVTTCLDHLRENPAVTTPNDLTYDAWTTGHWDNDTWIPYHHHPIDTLPLTHTTNAE